MGFRYIVGSTNITMVLQPMFCSPGPGTLRIRSGRQLRRICCRSWAKWSNERFYDAGDSFAPIKLGIGMGDRSGEFKVLAGFALYVIVVCFLPVVF